MPRTQLRGSKKHEDKHEGKSHEKGQYCFFERKKKKKKKSEMLLFFFFFYLNSDDPIMMQTMKHANTNPNGISSLMEAADTAVIKRGDHKKTKLYIEASNSDVTLPSSQTRGSRHADKASLKPSPMLIVESP